MDNSICLSPPPLSIPAGRPLSRVSFHQRRIFLLAPSRHMGATGLIAAPRGRLQGVGYFTDVGDPCARFLDLGIGNRYR